MTRHSCLYALTDEASLKSKLEQIRAHYRSNGIDIEITAEVCYHLVLSMDEQKFLRDNWSKLQILLSHSPFDINLSTKSNFISNNVVEIGPRASMKTACCTNMLNVFRSALIEGVVRIERSTRYFINPFVPHDFFSAFGDRMTECVYSDGMCFEKLCKRADFFEIDLLSDRTNLEKQNRELGLALDQEDLKYYYEIFANNIGRNPTDVELFDLAQSDSEHSRHWFFRGEISVDGERRLQSLMSSIRGTLETSNKNSLIAFRDNSSAIRGFDGICCLRPKDGTETSKFELSRKPVHLIYSAETHNFPTAVCPFQGATTGTGGRIRDIHATGKGAFEIAGVAGYSFGNLRIPGFEMPWETAEERHPFTLSTPLQVAIEASNGASDYGNKFGEPVICGFSRSFGQRLPSGERCEYLKPIMFSGGMGSIDEDQLEKEKCAPGQFLAKIGGPVYRIGVGGGAASSLAVQGDRENDLDFAAVQRGDAEMGGKLHRVVRSCAEMGLKNPLESIHDQGAGGNGNVIKEIVDGCGVHVSGSSFEFGDESASARELWTAEYQESDACLVNPNRLDVLLKVGRREKCTVSVVGVVDEGRKVILDDIETDSNRIPVNLPMDLLSERPMKEFALETVPQNLESFRLPPSLTVREALSRVLRLPSVACKRYLTCKVDRSVTGLVARQQCVGCLQTPLADVAVVALSHFQTVSFLPYLLFRTFN